MPRKTRRRRKKVDLAENSNLVETQDSDPNELIGYQLVIRLLFKQFIVIIELRPEFT